MKIVDIKAFALRFSESDFFGADEQVRVVGVQMRGTRRPPG